MVFVDGRERRLFPVKGKAEGRFAGSLNDPLDPRRRRRSKDTECQLCIGPECRFFRHEASGRNGRHMDDGVEAVQTLARSNTSPSLHKSASRDAHTRSAGDARSAFRTS
jgi:hypothetical protein